LWAGRSVEEQVGAGRFLAVFGELVEPAGFHRCVLVWDVVGRERDAGGVDGRCRAEDDEPPRRASVAVRLVGLERPDAFDAVEFDGRPRTSSTAERAAATKSSSSPTPLTGSFSSQSG